MTSQIKCKNCGAVLAYQPGTTSLTCEYCGAQNPIVEQAPTVITETDFQAFLSQTSKQVETREVQTVNCKACGATTSLAANVTTDKCPFCDTPLVATNAHAQKLVKPAYVLPFKIERSTAQKSFGQWIKKLWFAPSNLTKYATAAQGLDGLYIPFWTYDAKTESDYRGERGDDYTTTENYTEKVGNESVTKTREVTHTRWTNVSGHVSVNFDDVVVLGSASLPERFTQGLEPWPLAELKAYDENFLVGFRTESYQVDVKDGFGKAQQVMKVAISRKVEQNIGGDHQKITSLKTDYRDVTFKHVLLPLWISAYRYGNKVYRYLVNGATGKVQGERPYSWAKITLLIMAILGVIGVLYALGQNG